MKLYELLAGVDYQSAPEDCEILQVCSDSRQIEKGCLFICIGGQRFDGHDFAEKALELGAAAVVTERDLGLARQVLVANTRHANGLVCANFFGNPSRKLKLIGVTGTNGKTTTACILKQMLEASGRKTGLIGTIRNEISDMHIPAKYTTPDSYQLQAIFARMVQAGCEYAVMEVSSHALDQHRLSGCHFAGAVFTNLTPEHLDYHGDMDTYYAAKRKLFDMSDWAVINLDDKYGRRLARDLKIPVKTFSIERDEADFTAKEIRLKSTGSRFTFVGNSMIERMRFGMPGMYSVSNAMAAISVLLELGLDLRDISRLLDECEGVSGRTEIIRANLPFTVIRDYAHSPDALEKVVGSLREFPEGRMVTLFGCAGNRDKTKRPVMGEIAARLSDFVILTSDNPRDEDPDAIISEVIPGLKKHKTPYKVLADRYEAIQWALANCGEGDILLLAGKGHEDYQVLDYGTIYFDEKQIVLGLAGERKDPPQE